MLTEKMIADTPSVKVEYQAGESRYGQYGVDYMISITPVEDENGDEVELYAEMKNPTWYWECRLSEIAEGDPADVIKVYDTDLAYGEALEIDGEYEDEDGNVYTVERRECDDECATEEELKEEIIRQAIEKGISPARLEF